MARVFIVEIPSVNVEKANTFGEVKILIRDSKITALDTDYYAGTVIERLEEEEFNPKEDYFCLVGSLNAISIVIAAMIARWGSIRTLVWNPYQGRYVLRTLGRWKYVNKFKEEGKGKSC